MIGSRVLRNFEVKLYTPFYKLDYFRARDVFVITKGPSLEKERVIYLKKSFIASECILIVETIRIHSDIKVLI